MPPAVTPNPECFERKSDLLAGGLFSPEDCSNVQTCPFPLKRSAESILNPEISKHQPFPYSALLDVKIDNDW